MVSEVKEGPRSRYKKILSPKTWMIERDGSIERLTSRARGRSRAKSEQEFEGGKLQLVDTIAMTAADARRVSSLEPKQRQGRGEEDGDSSHRI